LAGETALKNEGVALAPSVPPPPSPSGGIGAAPFAAPPFSRGGGAPDFLGNLGRNRNSSITDAQSRGLADAVACR
jgi:hypothetical protein